MTRHGLALLAALTCAVPVLAENSPELVPVTRNRLCVTEGAMQTLPDGKLSISVAKTRAVLAASGSQARSRRASPISVLPSRMAPLRSGEIRQQFGLKLRAADGCNLVYAMWRFAPKPSLTVSVKSNLGLHTSKACGNVGYRNVSHRGA